MSSTPSLWPKGQILGMIYAAGAVRVGCAQAGDVSSEAVRQFDRWLAEGRHASMQWMERHAPLRRNPSNVLPGARTIISAAFAYSPPRGYGHPHIADYALGADYHTVLRSRLQPMAEYISGNLGALCRVCVDSAPLPQRYWAELAGVGRCGLSGQLIVPGVGAGVVLATILTSLELEPDRPLTDFDPCSGCDACVRACPGQALKGDSTLDCRRCLSYLTIEHRGPWPAEAPEAGERFFGCDICRRVCPHSRNGADIEPIEEFRPRPELMSMTAADFRDLTPSRWRRLSRPRGGSPLSRKKL